MAKAKRKTKTRSKAGRSSTQHEHAENDIDGCDLEFLDSEMTSDIDLPPARGGVEILKKRSRSGRPKEPLKSWQLIGKSV
jgi:hypothetical protein